MNSTNILSNDNNAYIKRLLDKYLPILNSFNITKIAHDAQKNLILNFAIKQDHKYGYMADDYSWYQPHFTDDILEIVLGVSVMINTQTNNQLKFNLLSSMHDAWALARLFKFTKDGLQPFTEPGGTDDKELVEIPLPEYTSAKVQKRRLSQFVEFNKLNDNTKYQDTIPADVFMKMWTENKEGCKVLYDLVYNTQYANSAYGGKINKYIATKDRVQLGGRKAIVYTSKRGIKYVKNAGNYVLLSKAIKTSK